MATANDILDDALKAIELIRPAMPILAAVNPTAGAIVTSALTLLYEGLVTIRAAEPGLGGEDVPTALASKVTASLQELAALRFGAMPGG